MTTREKIYEYIIEYKKENDGNSPSYQEIAKELGGISTNTVRYQLNCLAAAGLIELPEKYDAHGIRVVGGTWIKPVAGA